jgi:hypothetical protein
MRLSVASLRRVVKGDLRFEFGLSSYSGLELLRRYLRLQSIVPRLRTVWAGTTAAPAWCCSCWPCSRSARGAWSISAISPATRMLGARTAAVKRQMTRPAQ